jgi:hypothetical protein
MHILCDMQAELAAAGGEPPDAARLLAHSQDVRQLLAAQCRPGAGAAAAAARDDEAELAACQAGVDHAALQLLEVVFIARPLHDGLASEYLAEVCRMLQHKGLPCDQGRALSRHNARHDNEQAMLHAHGDPAALQPLDAVSSHGPCVTA